jgi:hypothetical protein
MRYKKRILTIVGEFYNTTAYSKAPSSINQKVHLTLGTFTEDLKQLGQTIEKVLMFEPSSRALAREILRLGTHS